MPHFFQNKNKFCVNCTPAKDKDSNQYYKDYLKTLDDKHFGEMDWNEI
jgi:hypothetical protein